MPGGDGTGPRGMGSMTGRAAGYCAGYDVPGYTNFVPARMGRGRGRGFAFRRPVRPMRFGYPGYYAPPVENYPLSKEEEMGILENEMSALEREHKLLKDEMENLTRRLNELKAQKTETE